MVADDPAQESRTNSQSIVDLGEDLLKSRTITRPMLSQGIHRGTLEERLANAEILLAEKLPQEAKKVLRLILVQDPHYVPARQALDQILAAELKLILASLDTEGSPRLRDLGVTEPEGPVPVWTVLQDGLPLDPVVQAITSEAWMQALRQTRRQSGGSGQAGLDLAVGLLVMEQPQLAMDLLEDLLEEEDLQVDVSAGIKIFVEETAVWRRLVLRVSALVILAQSAVALECAYVALPHLLQILAHPLLSPQTPATLPLHLELLYWCGRIYEYTDVAQALAVYRAVDQREQNYRQVRQRMNALPRARRLS